MVHSGDLSPHRTSPAIDHFLPPGRAREYVMALERLGWQRTQDTGTHG